ncbi:hypothetical protein PHET_11659 [Paragonimus heterotremus]|uniref:Uncharacterized protein n=1 Tax=Paragonimus heterotremus TaxID=100268 RepID=A0A8J4SEU3_9TREM|nr:hypothetical protein PHET_11659 [Paragonimus heterotremus]
MTSDRGNLIVVGNDAFSNESFSKLIAKLIEKFEITYLPDLSCCLSRVRQAIEHAKLGTKDPVAACELFLFSDFTDASELQTLVTLLPKARLMGYPAFVQCMLSQGKWIKPRPVFNFSMLGAMVCITGYRDRHIVVRCFCNAMLNCIVLHILLSFPFCYCTPAGMVNHFDIHAISVVPCCGVS